MIEKSSLAIYCIGLKTNMHLDLIYSSSETGSFRFWIYWEESKVVYQFLKGLIRSSDLYFNTSYGEKGIVTNLLSIILKITFKLKNYHPE